MGRGGAAIVPMQPPPWAPDDDTILALIPNMLLYMVCNSHTCCWFCDLAVVFDGIKDLSVATVSRSLLLAPLESRLSARECGNKAISLFSATLLRWELTRENVLYNVSWWGVPRFPNFVQRRLQVLKTSQSYISRTFREKNILYIVSIAKV